ncbi:MAG TPA: type II toxin-antitoxin system RelE/ParE family toxin [Acidimicrobiia bacterium]|nr:type II toxin-antitoxin system RelE/ParE family toxin [Acidimicrobiia bacterium]
MNAPEDGPFEVEWAAPARRALPRLPEKVATAAIEFIYGPLVAQPRRVGRLLRFELEGHYSARRGDHRILYRVDDEARRVVTEVIEHRADVYRRR